VTDPLPAPPALNAADFELFARVHAERKRRQTGRVPSPTTLYGKRLHLAVAARLMSCPDQLSLARVAADRALVEELLDKLAARMTTGSMRGPVYALIDFAEFARVQGWISAVAIGRADVPAPNPQRPITVYSAAEVEAFVAAARGKGLRWWAFLTFLADTGRRVGEVLSLRWDWYRPSESPPYFELPQTKTREPQYVPISQRLRNDVFTPEHTRQLQDDVRKGRRAFQRSPLVHPFPWSYATVHTTFENFCASTALPNRGFHCFRHTLVTQRLARGVPIQAVAALAGHSSISTTDRMYNHTNALHYATVLAEEGR